MHPNLKEWERMSRPYERATAPWQRTSAQLAPPADRLLQISLEWEAMRQALEAACVEIRRLEMAARQPPP